MMLVLLLLLLLSPRSPTSKFVLLDEGRVARLLLADDDLHVPGLDRILIAQPQHVQHAPPRYRPA